MLNSFTRRAHENISCTLLLQRFNNTSGDEWRGQISGKFYKKYYTQKKTLLFGWANLTSRGFDTVEEAESYIEKSISYPKIVKELEL